MVITAENLSKVSAEYCQNSNELVCMAETISTCMECVRVSEPHDMDLSFKVLEGSAYSIQFIVCGKFVDVDYTIRS
jgi:hypothetical protein